MRKTVDAIKKIEQNTRKIIKLGTANYFLTCVENLLTESRSSTTPFERNTDKQISISGTDQSIDTNRTTMEHISL